MKYKQFSKLSNDKVFNLGAINRKSKADEDDGEYDDNPRYGLYVKRLSVMDVDFHLNTKIQAPHLYNDLFQVLINADKDDNVRIWVDSGGGRIDTTMRILSGIRDTDANVTIIGCGLAASAASMLFLRSENVVVMPEMTMMIHSASYGTGGKQGEVFDSVNFENNQLQRLLDETYEGFLSPLEIEHLKMGKEYHMASDEIIQRLEARELFWQEQDKQQEAAKQVVKAPKPKPAAKAANKKK